MSRPREPRIPIPAERLDPAFVRQLDRFELHVIDAGRDVAYGLTAGLRLAYVSQAWRRFAAENGGDALAREWRLGRSIVDAWPEPLRAHLAEHFDACRRRREPWSMGYECSSPSDFRLFDQTVYPLPEGGFLVIHALREERPHDTPDHSPQWARFEDAYGLITMCSYCRRVRDVDGRWRRVSAWVRAMPPRVSHGLCEPCLGWYFGDL